MKIKNIHDMKIKNKKYHNGDFNFFELIQLNETQK